MKSKKESLSQGKIEPQHVRTYGVFNFRLRCTLTIIVNGYVHGPESR